MLVTFCTCLIHAKWVCGQRLARSPMRRASMHRRPIESWVCEQCMYLWTRRIWRAIWAGEVTSVPPRLLLLKWVGRSARRKSGQKRTELNALCKGSKLRWTTWEKITLRQIGFSHTHAYENSSDVRVYRLLDTSEKETPTVDLEFLKYNRTRASCLIGAEMTLSNDDIAMTNTELGRPKLTLGLCVTWWFQNPRRPFPSHSSCWDYGTQFLCSLNRAMPGHLWLLSVAVEERGRIISASQ